MISARWTRATLAACAAALVATLLAASAPQAQAQGPSPFTPPASNPLRGDGMWIWYVKRAQGGRVKGIVGKARKRGIETVLIKSGDAGTTWSQFSPSLVAQLKAKGLRVCAWQFVYGRSPSAEAQVGAASVARGADCLVIDAEGHYEGRYPQASTYISELRAQIGPDFPVALATFPYVDFHPAFPYSVFLGPGAAQYNLPQLYWKTIGHSVDEAFVHTYVFNRAYGRPIMPIGQVYLNPKKQQVKRFRKLALAHGMEGVSWWSWQHAGRKQWKAVGGGVRPLSAYAPYDSFPFLQLGAKGDLVAWAQQLLVGGGYPTPITGYFEAPTESAILALQANRGLAQTGDLDVPTWNVLLTFQPQKVTWTESGAVAAGRGDALREPRSAKLPAKRYEIPPPSKRAPRR